PEELRLEAFELVRELEEGKFAISYQARYHQSGRDCVLKRYLKHPSSQAKLVRRHIELRGDLHHPGIVGFHGWFEDERYLYLIFDYIEGGDLYSQIEAEGAFPEPLAASYVKQTAEALQYLHDRQIMHRDVKTENLIKASDGTIRLDGFTHSARAIDGRRNSCCGTLDYLPPEMLIAYRDKNSYSDAVDQWTLGVLAYELLTGKAPWGDCTPVEVQRRIKNLNMVPLPETVTEAARDLVHGLMQLEPESRFTLEAVLNHPWIREHC
ncbi:serine/threonine-protein kinase, partial [Thozetella sp. PMI_491]